MPFLVKDLIIEKIQKALVLARTEGSLPIGGDVEIVLEHPTNIQHGDFATNLPLRLARSTRMEPMEIAARLVPNFTIAEEIGSVWAAAPGFINFSLDDDWLRQQIKVILDTGDSYGTVTTQPSSRVLVEFVSVNPTGPVHIGHTRGAVLGSTLATVLEASGHSVTREYYVNDAGSQMDLFYSSVYSRYLQALGKEAEIPSGGYQGDYVSEIAQQILSEEGDRLLHQNEGEAIQEVGRIARNKMLTLIQDDLFELGVIFDNWFAEHTLFETGEYTQAMNILSTDGHLIHREGAEWFASSTLGQDKDNVVVRSSGSPTYFASDIAYHHNKFMTRGFDRAINIWGADHQGHVGRLKAAIGALGIKSDRLDIIISQMVTLKRGTELLKASKRTGEFVTLRELVSEVGADACRYFFLARSPGSQMDFDMELATRESSDNPVYYIQYAHARISSILNNALENGIIFDKGDVSLLRDPTELSLIRKMLLLPELVEKVSETLEPHHLPHYALELATSFHLFYENCRVLSNDPADHKLTLARLQLVGATQLVLAKVLNLMGMTTPEKM